MGLSLNKTGDLQARIDKIKAAAQASPALGARVADAMVEDNRRKSLAGLDKDGRPLKPLKPETLKHRKGGGPPLCPEGESSEIIAGYRVTPGSGERLAVGTWGVDWIGYQRQQGRDVNGLTPKGRESVAKALHEHLADELKGGS